MYWENGTYTLISKIQQTWRQSGKSARHSEIWQAGVIESLIPNLGTKLDELSASGPAGKASETKRIRDFGL